jgi:hypothetical protein
MSTPAKTAAARPERWGVNAGAADVALLMIPPDARRERVFEVDCRFVVRAAEAGKTAWHELRVEIDGAVQWSRRIETHAPQDSLDYHCRCMVAVGRPLRVRALAKVGAGSVRVALSIDAEEAPR